MINSHDLEHTLQHLKEETTKVAHELQAKQAEIVSKKAEIDRLKQEIQTMERDLEQKRRKLNDNNRELPHLVEAEKKLSVDQGRYHNELLKIQREYTEALAKSKVEGVKMHQPTYKI